MKRLLPLLLCLFSLTALSQKILNQRAERQGDKIIITYDIAGIEGDTYDVSIFSSHNNYNGALAQVTGDVGKSIKSGNGKRIEWNAKAELTPNFKGQLKFEIRAMVIARLGFTNPPLAARRGKNLTVNWRGGQYDNKIKIELLRSGTVQSTQSNLGNTGSHTWTLPADLAVGKDYQLRMSDGKETVTTGNFAVNRKVPLVLKAVPVVVVGVVAAVLLKPSTPKGDENVATPPDIGLD